MSKTLLLGRKKFYHFHYKEKAFKLFSFVTLKSLKYYLKEALVIVDGLKHSSSDTPNSHYFFSSKLESTRYFQSTSKFFNIFINFFDKETPIEFLLNLKGCSSNTNFFIFSAVCVYSLKH